jgi:HAMP domain-containing protein
MIAMKESGEPTVSLRLATTEPLANLGAQGTARKRGAGLLFAPLIGLVLVLGLLALAGWLMVRLPEQAAPLWAAQIVLAVAGALLIGVFALLIRRRLLQPLAYLRDWAREIEAGNLAARITEPVQGEFAELTEDINSLGTRDRGRQPGSAYHGARSGRVRGAD